MAFYFYILKSVKDNIFYTGQTQNLEERLRRHNSGRGRFTSGKRPWIMVYSEEYDTRELAQKREKEIKAEKSKGYIEYLLRHASERKSQ